MLFGMSDSIIHNLHQMIISSLAENKSPHYVPGNHHSNYDNL